MSRNFAQKNPFFKRTSDEWFLKAESTFSYFKQMTGRVMFQTLQVEKTRTEARILYFTEFFRVSKFLISFLIGGVSVGTS